MTLSPVHVAGRFILGGQRGISVRFPRFIRERPDKTPEEATTVAQLVNMYKMQRQTPFAFEDKNDDYDDDDDNNNNNHY